MSTNQKRRDFLQTSAAIAAIAFSESPVNAAPAARQIIDAHIHFYDPRRKGGIPWPPSTDKVLYKPVLPPLFEATAKPAGVTGAVVIEASPRLEDNQWILDLVKGHPMILAYVADLEAGKPEFGTNLARFRKSPLVRGIRIFDEKFIAGASSPAFIDDLKRLADADLSLDAIGETGTKWLAPLAAVMEKVPNLRVIINHMPEMPPHWTPAQMRPIAAHPNAYCKVSGVVQKIGDRIPTDVAPYRASLDGLWEMFGQDRVVYASNWPKSDHMAPYAKILGVVREYVEPKGASISEKFFSKNAKAFYKWV